MKNHKKDEIFIRENLVLLFCCSRLREDGADGRARAGRALELDAAMVILHGVLHDRQAQTRAAALETIVNDGREAAEKETAVLVNRGAALLDAAETEAAVSLPLTIEEAS